MSFVPSFEHYGTYDESEYPHLWAGRVMSLCPSVNPYGGTKLFDHSVFRSNADLTAFTGNPFSNYGALVFSAADDYALSDASVVNRFSTGSVSFWVKTPNDTAQTIISIQNGTTGNSRWNVFLGNGVTASVTNEMVILSRTVSGSVTYALAFTSATRTILFDDTWHHVVITHNGSTTKLFIDSIERTFTAYSGTDNGSFLDISGIDSLYWGGRFISAAFSSGFTGESDDLQVFNRVLLSSEIKESFMLGRAGTYTPKLRMFYPILADAQTFKAYWVSQANKVIQYGVAN